MPKIWTDTEIKYLKQNYNKLTVSQIAGKLHRTYNSVQAKAGRLGLCDSANKIQGKPWTPEEIDYLERFYEKRGCDFIAKKFNRSVFSVRRKAQNMGFNAYVCEELNIRQIASAFNCDSRVINRWIDKFDLPCREFMRGKIRYRMIDVSKFWKWAETHKSIIPFQKYEQLTLCPEPKWLKSAILDAMSSRNRNAITTFDKSTVVMCRNHGESFEEIAAKLNRSVDSVKHIWRNRD